MRQAIIVALLSFAAPAAAQEKTPEVEAAERAAIRADARSNELRRTADVSDAKLRKARSDAVALARQIQSGEARMTAIETRIARIEALRRGQQAKLAARQGEISRLLAALQTLSRRPAGLVLLEPQSAVTTARVSALLSAVRPVLAERTQGLSAELAATRRLRGRLMAARAQLESAGAALAANVRALDELQTAERARRDRLDAEADAERERARKLANRAIDLRGLARAVERDVRVRTPRDTVRIGRAPLALPGGMTYRMPAAGQIELGFGRRNDVGVKARGMTLVTRGTAQVTAPAGGRIAFAGPFREYGDIVIIEHDADMLTLLSGMERVDVVVGETVRGGAPVGRMGSVRPQLYIELRRSGKPVDPARYATRGG